MRKYTQKQLIREGFGSALANIAAAATKKVGAYVGSSLAKDAPALAGVAKTVKGIVSSSNLKPDEFVRNYIKEFPEKFTPPTNIRIRKNSLEGIYEVIFTTKLRNITNSTETEPIELIARLKRSGPDGSFKLASSIEVLEGVVNAGRKAMIDTELKQLTTNTKNTN